MRIKIVCGKCGSEDVKRDAWARWNEATQEWELDNVFDFAWCETCEGEATLKEVPANS